MFQLTTIRSLVLAEHTAQDPDIHLGDLESHSTLWEPRWGRARGYGAKQWNQKPVSDPFLESRGEVDERINLIFFEFSRKLYTEVA